MGTEEELQELCLEVLRDRYHEPEQIYVDSQVSIIKDCTFAPEDGDFTLYFGHTKGDIVLYRRIDSDPDRFAENSSFKPWWQNADDELNIPFAVIEVKRGDSATTGAIRSKSEDARELRGIFPFLGYFFVADEVDIQPHKFYGANKQFNGAFIRRKEAATREWIKKSRQEWSRTALQSACRRRGSVALCRGCPLTQAIWVRRQGTLLIDDHKLESLLALAGERNISCVLNSQYPHQEVRRTGGGYPQAGPSSRRLRRQNMKDGHR